jgi:septum formation protein
VPYRAVASHFEEVLDAGSAEELVAANADGKTREVAQRSGIPERGAVLGADTAVVVDARPWGKPVDESDARRMIAGLAGRTHVVLTAITLVDAGGHESHVEATEVRFRPLVDAEIDWYVGTGEWRDRAGGYAIQGAGAAIVESITGDYTNVVGLPVPALAAILTRRGLFPLSES